MSADLPANSTSPADAPGTAALIAAAEVDTTPDFYEVRASDTIQHVACKFGLTVPELKRKNRLVANAIFPGQKLAIRADLSSPARPTNTSISTSTSTSAAATPTAPRGPSGPSPPALSDPFPVGGAPAREVLTGRSTFFRPADEPAGPALAALHPEISSSGIDSLLQLQSATPLAEFVNSTMCLVRALLVTEHMGVVPGILEVTQEYLRFEPDNVAVVREHGATEFTLYFETSDMLPPSTQDEPPDFSPHRPARAAGAYHHGAYPHRHRTQPHNAPTLAPERADAAAGDVVALPSSSPSSASSASASAIPPAIPPTISPTDDASDAPVSEQPKYIEIRTRIVFGQVPTPATTQKYWFAVLPRWIDDLFVLLWDSISLVDVLSQWEMISTSVVNPFAGPAAGLAGPGGAAGTSLSSSPVDDGQPQRLGRRSGPLHVTIPTLSAKLLSPSQLISAEDVPRFQPLLPRRYQQCDWTIVYSTYEHGISLSTFYRRSAQSNGAGILLIRDTRGHVFGAFCNQQWQPSERFSGSGECFVFALQPHFRPFLWSGANQYFMMGKKDALVLGGGADGVAALYVDRDFETGSSGHSTTFGNDCIASSADFTIDGVELWEFVAADF